MKRVSMFPFRIHTTLLNVQFGFRCLQWIIFPKAFPISGNFNRVFSQVETSQLCNFLAGLAPIAACSCEIVPWEVTLGIMPLENT